MKHSKSIIVLLTWTFLAACNKFEDLFHIEGSIVENGINVKSNSDNYLRGVKNAESIRTNPIRALQEYTRGTNKKSIIMDSSRYLNCTDSLLRFQFNRTTNQTNTKRIKFCRWVARKKSDHRCAIPGVKETCALTCGTCSSYKDSPLPIRVKYDGKYTLRSCEWVASDESRCRIPGIRDTCRDSCLSIMDIFIIFFQSTNGKHWKNTQYKWGESSDICNWYGLKCTNGIVTTLSLDDNNLSGSIPVETGLLTQLTQLNLHNNILAGSIPSEIGQLTQLTQLELDYNILSGSIPVEIGELNQLTQLDLNNNNLTGHIHRSIGQLTKLQYLRIHYNTLTGSIPLEICKLHIWITYDSTIAMCPDPNMR